MPDPQFFPTVPAAAAPPAPVPPADSSTTLRDYMVEQAKQYKVDPRFAIAILNRESSGGVHARQGQITTSSQGARGMFQVLPETAKAYGLNPDDPFENIQAGVRNLAEALDHSGGDYEAAARYYHGGSDLRQHGPLTRAYGRAVAAELRGALEAEANQPPPTPPPSAASGAEAGLEAPWTGLGANLPARTPRAPGSNPIWDFGKEALASLDPRQLWAAAKALPELGAALHTDPAGAITRAGSAVYQTQRDLWDQGTAMEAEAPSLQGWAGYMRGLEGRIRKSAAMVPLLGPRIAQAQDLLGGGETARGLGAMTDVGLQVATLRGPKGPTAKVFPALFKPRLNPAEADAVAAGLARDPRLIDTATASGSPFALKLQRATEATYAGSPTAERVAITRGEQMPAWADDLAAQAGPTATPLTAGKAIKEGVQARIDALHARANRAYDRFRQIEADPAHTQQVQTGSYKDWNPTGDGTLVDVPIMSPMQLPVDLRTAKQSLRPLYDRLMRQLDVTKQQASPGLHVLRQVLDGPDFAAASQVEIDLGTIKSLARTTEAGGMKTASQGIASKGVQALSDAVDAAILPAGPDARRALDAGRAATRAKHAALDILDPLVAGKGEDVAAYRQLVQAKDASLGFLQDVQKLAPNEIPKVARATLEDIFMPSRAAGGWTRATGAFAKWQSLGPETKQLLFGAAHTKALDDFFLLGKMLERTPNASGTALTLSGVGSLLEAVRNPRTGVPSLLAAGSIAKLMNSPAGVRLLTQGLSIPANSVRAAAWAAEVNRFAGEEVTREKARQPKTVGTPPPGPPPPASPRRP